MDEHAGALDVVGDDLDMRSNQRDEMGARAGAEGAGVVRLCVVGSGLEAVRGPLDDRPQDVLLRRDVGVEAGALDVHGPRDVAHAGPRIPVLVEQGAGGVFDGLPPGRLDHRAMVPLTNAR